MAAHGAKLIDGGELARSVREDVSARIAAMKVAGKTVRLVALLVGGSPAGELYAKRQAAACEDVGVAYELRQLPADSLPERVSAEIRLLNDDPRVTGIMLHLPLPPHLDETELQYQISRVKDVEGVNPANIGHVVYRHTLIAPCTALAALECIRATGIEMRGAEAVVVGASSIAGKPAALLLTEEMATVTLCHIATKNLIEHTRRADIVVSAVGKPGLITASHVREGAVVIDVGIVSVKQPDGTRKIVGDVAFDEVSAKLGPTGWITPVPGGVGPMTVAMLLRNTLQSAALVHGIDLADDSVPATTMHCPEIPLRQLRRNELRNFLRQFLTAEKPRSVSELCQAVLTHFGPESCRPETGCPHYSVFQPEFWHVIKLALWDGQRAGEFRRVGGGRWEGR